MITLQQYLEQKYPTREAKEGVKILNFFEIMMNELGIDEDKYFSDDKRERERERAEASLEDFCLWILKNHKKYPGKINVVTGGEYRNISDWIKNVFGGLDYEDAVIKNNKLIVLEEPSLTEELKPLFNKYLKDIGILD